MSPITAAKTINARENNDKDDKNTIVTHQTRDSNWIVFPPIEIEYVKNEAMARRLKKLSQKNARQNNGFVNEIKRLEEKSALAESQYMPYYNVNIPKPHNLHDSMPLPIAATLATSKTEIKGKIKNIEMKEKQIKRIEKKSKRNSTNKMINSISNPSLKHEILDEDEFEFVINKNINQRAKYSAYKEGSAESFNIRGGNLQSFIRSKSYPSLKTNNNNNNNNNNHEEIHLGNGDANVFMNNNYMIPSNNKLITTPVTPVARTVSSGIKIFQRKIKILENIVNGIANNILQREEDAKYERRFGRKRDGAISSKPGDIDMALEMLSNKFINKYEHDPHFDITWGRIAGEKEEE